MKSAYRVSKLTVSHGIGSWPFFQPQLLVGALVTSAGQPHSLHGLPFDLSSLLKKMHRSIYRTLYRVVLMHGWPSVWAILSLGWDMEFKMLCKEFPVSGLIKLIGLWFVIIHDTELNLFRLL